MLDCGLNVEDKTYYFLGFLRSQAKAYLPNQIYGHDERSSIARPL